MEIYVVPEKNSVNEQTTNVTTLMKVKVVQGVTQETFWKKLGVVVIVNFGIMNTRNFWRAGFQMVGHGQVGRGLFIWNI